MASSSSSFFDIEPLNSAETCCHSMDTCSLCGKRLIGDHGIFMYRGDTPFGSEECRYHHMVRDEVVVRNNKLLKTEHAVRKEQRRHTHETPTAESSHVKLAVNVPVMT